MIPSTQQLVKWAKVSDDGSEVTLPSSTWIEVMWLLRTLEKIEDNSAVQAAFEEAQSRPNKVVAPAGDPDVCANCGHSRSLHFKPDAYVLGKCDFQYDLCSCREFEPGRGSP